MKRIEKTTYDENGKENGWSSKPHPIDKYWSRIKMKFKKDHGNMCCCYWCLKERFSTDVDCPECKRKMKKAGWHINTVEGPHKLGSYLYCKCGHKIGKTFEDAMEELPSPCRSMDRTVAFEASNLGSSPSKGSKPP